MHASLQEVLDRMTVCLKALFSPIWLIPIPESDLKVVQNAFSILIVNIPKEEFNFPVSVSHERLLELALLKIIFLDKP